MTKYKVLRGCWIIFVGLFGYDQFVTKIRKTMDKRSQLETSKKWAHLLTHARQHTTAVKELAAIETRAHLYYITTSSGNNTTEEEDGSTTATAYH